MKNPKVKHYFNKGSGSTDQSSKNLHDKQIIEQLKKSIEGKLKDPAMAKKAAQILSQMLEEESSNKQKISG